MILDQLKFTGVQQAHKEDRIAFTALVHWPGDLICGEGRYLEGDAENNYEATPPSSRSWDGCRC